MAGRRVERCRQRAARPAEARREAHRGAWRGRSRPSPSCPIRSAPCSREWTRPNGLHIQRRRVPLGVIGIIYESRPNVTADAGALCLKSGNAVILRGGSESARSSAAIHAVPGRGIDAPRACRRTAIQLVPTTDRAAVGFMLAEMAEYIDVIVPRGGKSLIERVQQRSPRSGHRASRGRLPCIRRARGETRDGARHRAQRQDAPHRRLRRGGDAAGRPRLRRHASRAADRGAARGGLRGARRRDGRSRPIRASSRPRSRIGTPSIWTRSSRCAWSTGWTRPSSTSAATDRSIPTRS